MAFKRGFTLAEILIVLMVIGVIATMTIPSMMKGVNEAHIKSSYKKAYNTVSNIAAAEKVAGLLPSTNNSAHTAMFFTALHSNLSVNSYVAIASSPVSSGDIPNKKDFKTSITINGKIYGSGDSVGAVTPASITTFRPSPWIVTDDNMAYSIMCGGVTDVKFQCSTAAQISAQPTQRLAAEKSCTILIVDVNGLSKGPNTFDAQVGPGYNRDKSTFRLNTFEANINESKTLDTLTGDQYPIFIGIDGASAGPRKMSVTGRIVADLK